MTAPLIDAFGGVIDPAEERDLIEAFSNGDSGSMPDLGTLWERVAERGAGRAICGQ